MVPPDEDFDELHVHLQGTPEDQRAMQADELDAIVPRRRGSTELYVRATSERIYRLIIEQMREGAVLVPSGVDTVVYCNRSFAQMVNLPAERVVGGGLEHWLEPVDGPPLPVVLEQSDPPQVDYLLHPHGGGTPLPVSVSVTLVLEGDRSLQCLIVGDLRMRRDVERLRQVHAELELSHRRKNEFLAMLGHELRNPLAPVRQAVELLEANAGPDEASYLTKARTVLTRQVTHLSRLVDDLLDVGRVTKGTLTINRHPVDLRRAIRAARESVERLIERRRHRVEMRIPAQPMVVHGDTVRLTQVFTNLISNAAKYTPDEGHLQITASHAEPSHGQITASHAEPSNGQPGFVVSIRDDGRGIEPDLAPYLFDPFVQSEATLDRSAGGIGVGLTLVRRIVELHDGRVTVHSEGSGQGSDFRVWLPAAPPTATAESSQTIPRSEALGPTPSRRILVVDDNEDAAEMLALVLRKRGYEVDLAFDGEQALEVALARDSEIVLLDIGLPGIDGYEVARRLRSEPGSVRRLLVAVTGYGQPEDRERALAAGFDHHMIKPVTIDALLAVIDPNR